MQLSDHFWYAEFCKRDSQILTPVQLYMLQNLAREILEPIRTFLSDNYSREVGIKIVSGLRFPSDTNRLKNQGYNPSETSDHLFGNIIKLRGALEIRKYGKYFQYSVGAADVIPACGAKEAWDVLRPFFNRIDSTLDLPKGKIKIGQVILERRNGFWLHISNPKSLVFQNFLCDTFLKKEPFLQSMDNGYTYEPIR